MAHKTTIQSLLVALVTTLGLSACDTQAEPEQLFEVEVDQATLVELAALADVDLENDDFVVYAMPLDEIPPYDEPMFDACGACIEGQASFTCIEARCVAADQVVLCEGEFGPGDVWPHEDGLNSCYCSEDGETVCTIIGAVTCEDGHQPGDMWDHEDGVNTCHCSQDGEILCTKVGVPDDADDYTP